MGRFSSVGRWDGVDRGRAVPRRPGPGQVT